MVALVVALVAAGLAVWALVKGPSDSDSASVFTGTKTDDPKGSICEAFNVIRNGVQINTNLQPPGGPEDVTGSMAVAANARVSLYDGGQYLLARLQPGYAHRARRRHSKVREQPDGRRRTVDLGHPKLGSESGRAPEGSGRGQQIAHRSVQVSARLA